MKTVDIKKYIDLMQTEPEQFNKLRETEAYPVLEIKNVHKLNVKNCNLKNVVFKSCGSGQWKSCGSGQWEWCYSGQWEWCDSGQWKSCDSGQWKSCDSGQWEWCYYGQIITSGRIHLKSSYLITSWCDNIKKEKCPKNDTEAYVLIHGLEKHPDNPKLVKLYKSVKADDTDFYTGKIHYEKGKEIICPDWDSKYNGECGQGFHLSPTFEMAQQYNVGKCKSFWVHVNDFKVYPPNLTKVRAKKVLVID